MSNATVSAIDIEAIRRMGQMDRIAEDIGAGRTLSVWLHRTARGAKQVYEVRVDEGNMGIVGRGAHLPERALDLVRRYRREWSR
jgi:hypothetical protein